jgi:hypothetical protein
MASAPFLKICSILGITLFSMHWRRKEGDKKQ